MSVIGLLSSKFTIDWRQKDCIEKIQKKNSPNYRVFAFEDEKFKKGCRKFVATNIRDFYLWYRECPPELKHFYELVLESFPCRMYFDLEFHRQSNADVDGIALVQTFCRIASNALEELLGMPVDPLKNFLILDSSSKTKFSAHVIVHIQSTTEPTTEMLFPDNLSIKPIVMFICSKLLKENCCLVKTENDDNKLAYFCDLSVYSRNRNFRIFQSSKFGKAEQFKLADYCNFYENLGIQLPKNAQIFIDSLVIPYDYHKFPIINLANIASMRSLKSALELCKKQLVGEDEARKALLPPLASILREKQQIPVDQNGQLKLPIQQNTLKSSDDCFISTVELHGGTDASPFPQLDAYMLNNVFKKFNSAAEIRLWRLICTRVLTFENNNNSADTDDGQVVPMTTMCRYYQLQYQINFSRFCMNRGREHRNNNVYWVVHFSTFYYVQRCFDKIDCPNYISPAFAFPREICDYLFSNVEPVFKALGITADRYTLPDPETMNRFQAESDSFDNSLHWREMNETIDWLELFTPLEQQRQKAEEEERKRQEEEAAKENQIDDESATESDETIIVNDGDADETI